MRDPGPSLPPPERLTPLSGSAVVILGPYPAVLKKQVSPSPSLWLPVVSEDPELAKPRVPSRRCRWVGRLGPCLSPPALHWVASHT